MTSSEQPHADGARIAPQSARWALALTFVVCWFFLTAAGYATGPLQSVPWLFVTPSAPAFLIGILGLFSLVGFVASLFPLGARWSRETIAVRAAGMTIVASLLLHALSARSAVWQTTTPGMILTTTAAIIATAGGALYLNSVIGVSNRRAIAGGVVGALIARHFTHVMPVSMDPLTRMRAVVAFALVLAIAGAFAAVRWKQAPAEDRAGSFERRAGGLRLRGAFAFGVLLFFELTYGLPGLAEMPPRSAGWGPWLLAGIPALVGPAGAWLFVVRGSPVRRHRLLAVSLAIAVTFFAIIPFWVPGSFGAAVLSAVIAHTAALMLFGRALAPASGRRSGRKLATGLMVFVALSIAHAATFVTGDEVVSATYGRLPSTVLTVLAGVVLAIAMYLTPRPIPTVPPLPDRWLVAIAAAIPLFGLAAALL